MSLYSSPSLNTKRMVEILLLIAFQSDGEIRGHHSEGWWFEVGDVGELPNSRMVGTWIIRLPDLPTPTAAQEAATG